MVVVSHRRRRVPDHEPKGLVACFSAQEGVFQVRVWVHLGDGEGGIR